MKHTVYFIKATFDGILVYTCKAGVNYGCRTAGLSYNDITFFCHTVLSFTSHIMYNINKYYINSQVYLCSMYYLKNKDKCI